MDRRVELDWIFLLAVLGLSSLSVMTLSHATGLAGRQLTWLGLGLVAGVVFAAVPYRSWGELAPLIYGGTVLALLYVLAAGVRVHGSRSWIDLGPFHVQPSEFMKLGVVLLLSRVLAGFRGGAAGPGLLASAGLLVAVPLLLVAKQPDLGTALTFVAVLGVYLVAVGLTRRTWAALAVAAVLGGAGLWTAVLKDYQKERIRTFMSPETDPHAMGYQIIQSRIAIGSGGVLGKGFAGGTQSQLDFLPEKSTDFLFAVLAEAWGFGGSLVVLGLYGLLLVGGFRVAMHARDAFGAYIVLGIMSVLATHVLINLGVVTGLLPTIGIPLPLMSYGGSSVVTTLAGIGLVVNVRMRAGQR